MKRDNRQEALRQLLEIAISKGYVIFDDIISCADINSLSIGEIDWLADAVGARNIIIYDEEPKSVGAGDIDYDDYAQIDYELDYAEVIEMCPDLEPLIDDVRGIKPPQRGEVARLKYQVKEGNIHARNRMVEMYMRLAIRLALQRAKAFDLDIEETLGDAFVGLLNAVDKYDPDYSGPFIAFASFWIYQIISKEQCTKNPNIYFPLHKKGWFYTMYPLLKARGCMECDQVFRCEKVITMICETIHCEREQARDVLIASNPCVSLDAFTEDDMQTFGFVFSDDEMLEKIESTLQLEEVLRIVDSLTRRQREILIGRYGLGDCVERTLEQLGQEYHLTRERIRQIEATALKKVASYYMKGMGKRKPLTRNDRSRKLGNESNKQ